MSVQIKVAGLDASQAGNRLCTHCIIVFVALDGVEGKPIPVPAWQPQTDDDRLLAEYAIKVMELSKGIEQTVAQYQEATTKKAD